ncbi:MAG: flavodoxin-dependent (E)-4-hydroxy-3-methylbut-2-enyl-diphosphate synthase [Candidatus Auribacterota bacterium]|nr:flavodoxin-dependent (E)-4-hydroxy-3-methylbut-2-enyl-diphosphate synthase [Candidatus Auribacterota bacterium]
MQRRKTRSIKYGTVTLGGDAPVTVQSMTNTRTDDVHATVCQIMELYDAGCEIIRVAVPDMFAAKALPSIISQSPMPVIADIHFDYRLALASIEAGIHGLRLNPGNIKKPEHIKTVVIEAKSRNIPIRIGANAGSLSKEWLENTDHSLPHTERIAQAMVSGAFSQINILQDLDFFDIVVSLKSSDVWTTIHAYRQMAKQCDYPFHLGITEAGPLVQGTVKSSIGLGMLLADGIGDTVRVSLTDTPVKEVQVAHMILRSLGLRKVFPEIVSCPTCGRTRIPVIPIAREVEEKLSQIRADITVAVMGCEVNGPGEAREADIGIAGGDGFGILFKKGKIVERVPEAQLVDRLLFEIKQMIQLKGDNNP